MWQWLADNPDKDKFNYFRTNHRMKELYNGCHMCEYQRSYAAKAVGDDTCDRCLIAKYVWPEGCMNDPQSAYTRWAHTDDRAIRNVCAQRIADACTKVIKVIERRKL